MRAHDSSTQGILSSKQFTGTAGGFAGSVANGSVKDCAVTDLMSVSGVNYTGGFVGHLGKAGTVDVDNVGVNKLLGATAGVLDVWGAHVERSTVMGVADGYTGPPLITAPITAWAPTRHRTARSRAASWAIPTSHV